MSAPLFADVAVPLPILQLFTYQVPEDLRESVVPGVRVIVPFGSRRLVGVVVRAHAEGRSDAKPLGFVLDREPVIGAPLLELGLWLSEYYLAPPGEAFRIMLPPGLFSKSMATDSSKPWPVLKQLAVTKVSSITGTELRAGHAELLSALSQVKLPLLLTEARQRGMSLSTLKTLARKGLVTIEETEIDRSPWSVCNVQQGEIRRHALNDDQERALRRINEATRSGCFQSVLLHGVTGSGKTEVYLNAIDSVLAAGKSALLLVPEIGLTPQVARYFQEWFKGRAAILHSALSDGERFDQWRRIQGAEARVVIGTRSALFAPLSDLSLIIVDEEQDGSYKQDETPRYHARDTAIKRAQIENAVVVLGSATPQLETYYLAVRRGQHAYEKLASRIQARPLPLVRVVDMRTEFQNRGKAAVISQVLEESISRRLEERQQVLVLLNRRGYSPLLICRSCGYTETCDHCSISLTFHQETNALCCHYCGSARRVPSN